MSGAPPISASPSSAVASPAPSATASTSTGVDASSGSTAGCARASVAPVSAAVASRLLAALRAGRASIASPGLEAAVLLPDGTGWTGAVGWAADGVPLTTGDALPWASAGKPAIAATLLRLSRTDGHPLTTQVRTLLPGVRTAAGATLADLLAHRAGLSEPFNDPAFVARIAAHPLQRWNPAAVLAATSLVGRRGSFLYSNSNYIAAGELIASEGGAPWPSVVRRLVLGPAGSAAWAPAVEASCGPVGHSFSVVGSNRRDLTGSSGMPPFPALLSSLGAAGGFVGTALDLALMGRQIATSPDLAPLFTVRTSVTLEGPYGMGVSRTAVLGHAAVGHGGRLAGTRTVWRCILPGGPCVAVLANRVGIEVEPIAEALLRIVLPR